MRLRSSLDFLVILPLLLAISCNAWTLDRHLLSPRSLGVSTLVKRCVNVAPSPTQAKRISLPSKESSWRIHRQQWPRTLAHLAGLLLVTSLLSPDQALASSLPQSLPSPLPPMVELQLTLRLLFASLLGAAVGKERSSTHKHSAGVRTMALVSLGASAFTICSIFGFTAVGGGRCDPSRMAANVASGVGFVGAGVITTTSSNPNDSRQSIVHGLTTATAIWISAAIGVACGVGMPYVASVATLSTITILRFGRVTKTIKPVGTGELYYSDPEPQRTKVLSSLLSSTMASLGALNQQEEYDDRVESGHSEVDTETDHSDEQHIISQTKLNSNDARAQGWQEVISTDRDVMEFHATGQATLLEQAIAASRGKNLTQIMTNQGLMQQRNSSSLALEEDYVGILEPRRSAYSSRHNETMAP